MRLLALLVLSVVPAATLTAQSSVTVRQFEGFLLSRGAQKESDSALARQLASMQLSEQLTSVRLAKLEAVLRVGPQAAEQIERIAAESIFQAPPLVELVDTESPPDPREQDGMLQAAREYAKSSSQRLPDFLASRSTRSFDNAPEFTRKKHPPEMWMHFVGARRREVAVRAGREVYQAEASGDDRSDADRAEGMTTWGEFGSLLATVLQDAKDGSMVWSRWQTGSEGKRLAVFHYSVPRSASHDFVDLSFDDGQTQFRDKPRYHGELYIDPANGTIFRITLDAELPSGAPVLVSRISVQYAHVDIGGRTYICPIRGTAVSAVHNQQMELLENGGPERFTNLVYFTDYHKFASTSRIVSTN